MIVWGKRKTMFAVSFIITVILLTGIISSVYADDPPFKQFLPYILNGGEEGAPPSTDMEQLALDLVAQQNNLAVANLEVVNSLSEIYPMQQTEVSEFKILDNQSGESYGIALNSDNQQVDVEQIAQNEQTLYAGQFGKLDPNLIVAFDETGNAPVDVVVWLKDNGGAATRIIDVDFDSPISDVDIESNNVQAEAQRAAEIQSLLAPTAARITGLGHSVEVAEYAPAIYATLDPATVTQIASWPEVEQVYLAPINETENDPSDDSPVEGDTSTEEPIEPELEIVDNAIRANSVHSRRILGLGIRTAQIEVQGRVPTNNPYLPELTHNRTYVCSSNSSHSTGVAGIIKSLHLSRFGISPGTLHWLGGSCNGITSQLQNRSTAAANWGARAINLSWGGNTNLVLGANDRFYDTMVFSQRRTVVKSAGNRASGCGLEGNVTSPGLAFNVITVGNFNDRNTTSRSDDVMDTCSSWRDPSGREKPEVAAPGANINSTTTTSPWTGNIGSGTSYAAPVVTAMSALIMQRDTRLRSWPEIVKAIIMASALNNIEGAARLSEFDGAGGVDALYADDVTRGYRGGWSGRSYSCSTATNYTVRSTSLIAGKRTRVVLTWPQNPSYSLYGSRPSADLDLRVLNASGTIVASSSSLRNNYEIVDFTPTSSGTYRFQVRKFSCSLTPSRLGLAFWIAR